MYLPLLALLLIAAEALHRFRLPVTLAVVIIAVLSLVTYQRNRLYSHPIPFWLDTVPSALSRNDPPTRLGWG